MPNATLALTFVVQALMLALIVILLWRSLYKRFPVFTVYCVSIPILELVRIIMVDNPTKYFVFYWITEACFLVFAFFAMLSVLRPLTELEYVRHPWSRLLLFPFVVVMIALCLLAAFVMPINKTAAGHFASAIYVFVIGMSLAELFLFIVSFRVRRRAIVWTRYEFGILKGFGALVLLKLIAYSALFLRILHFKVAPPLEQVFQAFPVGAFLASATVWLVAFSKPEPPQAEPPDMGTFLDTLRVVLEQYEAQLEYVKRIARHLDSKYLPLPQ